MAFAWLVIRAAHRRCTVRYKGSVHTLERGQLMMSVRDMADHMDRDKGWVERLLLRLRKADMIETAGKTVATRITICNYDAFQAPVGGGKTAQLGDPRQEQDSRETQNKELEELEEGTKDNKTRVALPDWLPREAWSGWLEMRRRKRVPSTARALRLAIGELEKLKAMGFDPGKVLDEATMKGWQGIYEPSGRRDDMRTNPKLTL